jgi:hypothetical protein
VEAHFDRDFDRGGAVVGEEAAIQARRGQRHQTFRESHGGFVGETGENDVFELR